MMPAAAILAPHVRCFSGKSDSYVQSGFDWRRMTPEDEAHGHTGYDRETHEANVGIYIVRRPNGLVCVGFDLYKLDVNLRPSAVERLANRWRREAANLSKSLLRAIGRRVHFSRSFAQFEIAPERLDEWRAELSATLTDADSYEAIERRTADV
jgi:hypothetical protein